MLSKKEILALAPQVNGGWVGGMLTPSDGRAEPFVAVPALARAARGVGVSVVENCAVRTVETEGGSVSAVWTENGLVRTDSVVLAGGAWSTYFTANMGLDLPQLMVRSTVGRTHPTPVAELPNVSMPGFTMRRRADGGYTLATGDIAEHYLSPNSFRYLGKFLKLLGISYRDVRLRPRVPAGYPGDWGGRWRWRGDQESPFERMRVLNPPASALVCKRLRARLPLRAPSVAEAGIAEVWAGMIDVTPDAVPYICEAPEPKGLFIGTGMSGHGFGIGPAVGRVLADLVQGHSPGHDLTRFRFNRFSDGTPIVPGPY
jgi:glycine/D-amino acid oxidase-like deaminating enzyme